MNELKMNLPENHDFILDKDSEKKHDEELKIIDNVIAEADFEKDDNGFTFELYYGGKKLSLYFFEIESEEDNENIEPPYFSTFVENLGNKENKTVEKERKENETTILYKAAKKIMQNTADSRKSSIKYHFRSHYKKMLKWAESVTKGYKIFKWEMKGWSKGADQPVHWDNPYEKIDFYFSKKLPQNRESYENMFHFLTTIKPKDDKKY